MSDREAHFRGLMLRGLDGDAVAWRVLLTEFGAHLRSWFARQLFDGGADAEDLVQETLIALHAKRATWDPKQSFTGWAWAIARHKLIDHLRKRGRRPTRPIEEAAMLFADHTVEDGATRADLARCLSALPVRQRRLIEDVRLKGLSVAEAADRHGYTVTAAKVSLHRSLKTLNARLQRTRRRQGGPIMRTDDLISALSADLPVTRAADLRVRLLTWMVPAAIVCLAGVWLTLGFRPDLTVAMAGPTFWAKAGYTAAMAVAGFWLLDRSGRPGAAIRPPVILLAAIGATLIFVGLTNLMMTPEPARLAAVMGGSARVCSLNVAGLAVIAAPFILFAGRPFAPLRPGLAGAATGLMAGGLAATLYGLHCPEHSAAFVAVWYTLGMMIPVAVGAVIGRFVWRW